MNKQLSSATLKLTAWYLVILMGISLLFSVILFGLSTGELHRSLRAPTPGMVSGGMFFEDRYGEQLRESRYDEGVARMTGNLIILNLATLLVGGGLSYVLAQRTLRPIHEAMEAQGRFTSDASHELRTPLTVMQSEIEVGLRDPSATKADYRELLESSLDEVGRLHELSDRLLQLASERELELAPTSLDDVATEAMNRVIKVALQKDIAIDNTVGRVVAQANLEALADAVTGEKCVDTARCIAIVPAIKGDCVESFKGCCGEFHLGCLFCVLFGYKYIITHKLNFVNTF